MLPTLEESGYKLRLYMKETNMRVGFLPILIARIHTQRVIDYNAGCKDIYNQRVRGQVRSA